MMDSYSLMNQGYKMNERVNTYREEMKFTKTAYIRAKDRLIRITKIMKKLLFLVALTGLLTSCNPTKQEAREEKKPEIEVGDHEEMSDKDLRDLVIYAMINNRLQTALAELADEQSKNPMFQVFCEMIINNHERFQYYDGILALSLDIEIPQGLSTDAEDEYERIKSLPPAEFDREFVDLIIKTHKEDIARIERLLASENEIVERTMVEEMHDSLVKHLQYAEHIKENLD
jgi:putative membrane protein